MQGLFVFAVVLAAAAVATFIVLRTVFSEADRSARRMVSAVAWGLTGGAAVTLFMCSYNPVGPRDIGVVTAGGRLDGHLPPGYNFTAPWVTVTSIDDSYQLTDETITVRIAGGQTAQAPVQVRWNAVEAAADDIFGNYKTTKGMEKGLLDPDLNVATNTVLNRYNPLNALASGAPAGTPPNPDTAQLGARIEALLEKHVGADIRIATFNLQPLVYDDAVQNQINAATGQQAKTVVAQEAEKTAAAQAAANKALEAGLVNNPLVLVQQCMTAIASGEFKPPAGFSCWPGSGSGVVIPAEATAAGKK